MTQWNRLLVEAAAIVVSILLAFAIDAWWDERNERIEEQEILRGLHEEFGLIRDVLNDNLQLNLQRIQALQDLMVEFESGPSDQATEVLAAGLEDLLAPTTSDISNGTLRALLSSGRLEIIENTKLRKHLVGWESAIGEVWDDEQSNAKLVYDVHVPFLINEGYGVGETLNIWNPGQPAPVRLLGDDPAAVDRLLQDPRFRSIVEIRYLYKLHTTEEFEQAVAAAEEILTEIEKGL